MDRQTGRLTDGQTENRFLKSGSMKMKNPVVHVPGFDEPEFRRRKNGNETDKNRKTEVRKLFFFVALIPGKKLHTFRF
jgi:hypothetical protein